MVVTIGAITVIELVIPYWIISDNCWLFSLNQLCERRDNNSDWAMPTRNSVKLHSILKLLSSNR